MDKIIACSTIKREIEALQPDMKMEFLEYGLHRVPDKLSEKLQKAVNRSEKQGYTRIRLGYGLCSHGLTGLNSNKATLIAPRMHDCITILLGSKKLYKEEFSKNPGTIYLSRGWIEFGGDPLSQYEDYKKLAVKSFAEQTIERENKNYSRLVFINTGVKDLKKYRDYARKAAEFFGLNYEERKGDPELLKKLIKGKKDEDLAFFEPGRIILRTDLV